MKGNIRNATDPFFLYLLLVYSNKEVNKVCEDVVPLLSHVNNPKASKDHSEEWLGKGCELHGGLIPGNCIQSKVNTNSLLHRY